GLMKFTQKGINHLKLAVENCKKNKDFNFKKAFMTDIFQFMVLSGYKLKSVPISGNWIEVDTVEDYKNKITVKRLNNIINKLD
ncbi:hypothetical protein N9835_00225, partial [Alphaproteobacteria bacterium]|nr:hypothetical protein [Alphaproteobacteria bacterium]